MIVRFVSNLYNSILQIVDFIVGRTSDTLADIMIRALPLLAPLPNAISIYYVVQHEPLNYNTWQAFGAAAALECMFFALTEVTLKMWDGVQKDRRYIRALQVMIGLFVAYFLLVVVMVAVLEVKNGNYAPLAFPFVSVVAALALGCERWHKRNAQQQTAIDPTEFEELQLNLEATIQDSVNRQRRVEQLHSELESVRHELDESRTVAGNRQTELENAQRKLEELRQQCNQLGKSLNEFLPSSVLGRLNDVQRQKMDELFRLVVEQRITGAGDLVRSGMPKSDAYALWPVAVAAQLIYLNGDGAYHVRSAN